MTKTKEFLIEFVKIFYGELFNKKNKFFLRIKRIIARFKFANIIIYFIQYFNINRKIKTFPTMFEDLDVVDAVEELKSEGIYKKINLSESNVNTILEYCSKKKFNINRNPNNQIDFNKRHEENDLYILNLMNPHLDCEIINNIIRDEKIIKIVKDYLGVVPKINSTQIFWSIPCFDSNGLAIETPNKEFGYHYDIDGFKFIKLFFYLTDILDENSGNHVFIKKNNKEKILIERIFRRISEEKIEKNYKDRIYNIMGKKGTGFLEDTSFYHKGKFPLKERGMLACIYNISDW